MMSISFSLLMYFSGGKSIYTLPDWWTDRVVFYESETASGDLVRITLPIVAHDRGRAIHLGVDDELLDRPTALCDGRQSGSGTAHRHRASGRLQFVAYGYLGVLAAIAGMLQAHRVGESVPNAMFNTELAVLVRRRTRRRKP